MKYLAEVAFDLFGVWARGKGGGTQAGGQKGGGKFGLAFLTMREEGGAEQVVVGGAHWAGRIFAGRDTFSQISHR